MQRNIRRIKWTVAEQRNKGHCSFFENKLQPSCVHRQRKNVKYCAVHWSCQTGKVTEQKKKGKKRERLCWCVKRKHEFQHSPLLLCVQHVVSSINLNKATVEVVQRNTAYLYLVCFESTCEGTLAEGPSGTGGCSVKESTNGLKSGLQARQSAQ